MCKCNNNNNNNNYYYYYYYYYNDDNSSLEKNSNIPYGSTHTDNHGSSQLQCLY